MNIILPKTQQNYQDMSFTIEPALYTGRDFMLGQKKRQKIYLTLARTQILVQTALSLLTEEKLWGAYPSSRGETIKIPLGWFCPQTKCQRLVRKVPLKSRNPLWFPSSRPECGTLTFMVLFWGKNVIKCLLLLPFQGTKYENKGSLKGPPVHHQRGPCLTHTTESLMSMFRRVTTLVDEPHISKVYRLPTK